MYLLGLKLRLVNICNAVACMYMYTPASELHYTHLIPFYPIKNQLITRGLGLGFVFESQSIKERKREREEERWPFSHPSLTNSLIASIISLRKLWGTTGVFKYT